MHIQTKDIFQKTYSTISVQVHLVTPMATVAFSIQVQDFFLFHQKKKKNSAKQTMA